jgi:hypothetical protein
MTAIAQPLFVLEIGPEKVRVAPTSAEELSAWLDAEYAVWEKAHVASAPPGQSTDFLGNVQVTLKNLARARNAANQAKAPNAPDAAQQLNAAQNHMRQVYVDARMPLSTSVRGRLLAELATEDPFAAKVALYMVGVGTLVNSDITITSPSVVQGLVTGALVRRLSDQTVFDSAARKLIEQGETETARWASEFDKAVERVNETHRAIEKQLGEFLVQRQDAKAANDEQVAQFKKAAAAEITESKKQLEAFQERTSKDIALKAPTEYWRGKGRKHRRNGYLLFAAMALLMAGFAVAADFLFPSLIVETPEGKQLPSYGHIAVIVVTATLAFWLLRIVVRIFFSQIHLAQDAEERVTMVTTYLALSETGKFAASDLAIVLNALFRNAADGIVKDEGMPPSLWEIVTRQGKP